MPVGGWTASPDSGVSRWNNFPPQFDPPPGCGEYTFASASALQVFVCTRTGRAVPTEGDDIYLTFICLVPATNLTLLRAEFVTDEHCWGYQPCNVGFTHPSYEGWNHTHTELPNCSRAGPNEPLMNGQGCCHQDAYMAIIDEIKVPTVPPGDYVVRWRWDCE